MKTNIVALIGVGLLFLGIIFIIISSFLQADKNTKTNVAVGGFIGPIPFGFFSSKKMIAPFFIILLCLVIVYFVLRKYMV